MTTDLDGSSDDRVVARGHPPGGERSRRQEDLWRAHAAEMVRYATLLVGPADAPDLVSIAFFRVAGPAREVRDARAYLMRAVTNAAADQRRSARRRQARDLHAVLPATTTPVEPHLDARHDIRHAVADLSVRQRAVVYLTYWEDLDAPGIAAILGISHASVRRHLARARSHLRKALR